MNAIIFCTGCLVDKPRVEFCEGALHPNSKRSRCKKCRAAKVRVWSKTPRGREINARHEAMRVRDPKPLMEKFRQKRYGITPEQYVALVNRAAGRCEACGCPPGPKGLGIDHDHKTGEVRGLLCDRCNLAIGYFKDDVTLLERAIAYLKKHSLEGVVVPDALPENI